MLFYFWAEKTSDILRAPQTGTKIAMLPIRGLILGPREEEALLRNYGYHEVAITLSSSYKWKQCQFKTHIGQTRGSFTTLDIQNLLQLLANIWNCDKIHYTLITIIINIEWDNYGFELCHDGMVRYGVTFLWFSLESKRNGILINTWLGITDRYVLNDWTKIKYDELI